jgi:hypothetical protein
LQSETSINKKQNNEKYFLKPWIDKTYSNGIGNSGIKVMIIGASHYCSLDENNSNYDVVKAYCFLN